MRLWMDSDHGLHNKKVKTDETKEVRKKWDLDLVCWEVYSH